MPPYTGSYHTRPRLCLLAIIVALFFALPLADPTCDNSIYPHAIPVWPCLGLDRPTQRWVASVEIVVEVQNLLKKIICHRSVSQRRCCNSGQRWRPRHPRPLQFLLRRRPWLAMPASSPVSFRG